MADTHFPLPDTDWDATRPFWAGAKRGELVIPRCDGCGGYRWYPAATCKACGGEPFSWTVVSGRGRLFSWAVVRHGFLKPFEKKVPYVTALVTLEEDPAVRLVTNLVDCEADGLTVDMPVRVVFRPLVFPDTERQVMAPMFTPASETVAGKERNERDV